MSLSSNTTKSSAEERNNQNKKSKIKNVGLDKFITYLLKFEKSRGRLNIPAKVISSLSNKTYDILEKEPNLLELKPPIHVVGDIHGQYDDLLRILKLTGLPPKCNYLFLGDYVDRGDYSIEVLALLFSLKIKFPDHVFLIRGNHECESVNKNYGFYEECHERYDNGTEIWKCINRCLANLPLSALIDKKIFCVHGGLSPELEDIYQINSIHRNTKIPDEGLLCDMTWSDPEEHSSKWEDSDRGVSFTFNKQVLEDFIDNNDLDLVVRAHQVVDGGYKFFGDQQLVTVFSAPNYCGECGNCAAVLKIDANLNCSFVIMKPVSKPCLKQSPDNFIEKKELNYL